MLKLLGIKNNSYSCSIHTVLLLPISNLLSKRLVCSNLSVQQNDYNLECILIHALHYMKYVLIGYCRLLLHYRATTLISWTTQNHTKIKSLIWIEFTEYLTVFYNMEWMNNHNKSYDVRKKRICSVKPFMLFFYIYTNCPGSFGNTLSILKIVDACNWWKTYKIKKLLWMWNKLDHH